jgi:hypothetical protein
MGYACPVCSDPQADADHLANHLAFTAMLRGGDHERWLAEHVPDWEQLDVDGLGERVAELAEDEEYPQVFEDTTGDDRGHGGEGRPDADDLPPGAGSPPAAPMDDEARAALEEARELTRRRLADEESETE